MTTRAELIVYMREAGVKTGVASFYNVLKNIDKKRDFSDTQIVDILLDISDFLETQTNPAMNLRDAGLTHGVLNEIGKLFVA